MSASSAPAKTRLMIAFLVPKSVVKRLGIASPVLLRAGEWHVTLTHIDDPTDAQDETTLRVIGELAAAWSPLKGVVSGLGRFTQSTFDGRDVWYASVDSDALTTFRQEAVERLEDAELPISREHGFIPHITLAVLGQNDPNPWEWGLKEPVPLTFREIAVKRAENAPRMFPFRGKAAPSRTR